tara:strand:+ start:1639 stop:2226 length:588 start_codon:yes stop_codon:yes gene_type:complete
MKKNLIIQIFLVIFGVSLLFFTYFLGSSEKNNLKMKKEIVQKESALSNPDVSSLVENVSYVGSNNDQIFFEINSKVSEIFNDKPDLSYMKNVTATIRLADGRIIYIKADKAVYNKLTNDTSFAKNIVATESDNQITCDNLDLVLTENLIKIYNNINITNKTGVLLADMVKINMLEKNANIFMYDNKNKVKLKVQN